MAFEVIDENETRVSGPWASKTKATREADRLRQAERVAFVAAARAGQTVQGTAAGIIAARRPRFVVNEIEHAPTDRHADHTQPRGAMRGTRR